MIANSILRRSLIVSFIRLFHLFHSLLERFYLLFAQFAESQAVYFDASQKRIFFVELFGNIQHFFHCCIFNLAHHLFLLAFITKRIICPPGDYHIILFAPGAFLLVGNGHKKRKSLPFNYFSLFIRFKCP